MSSCANLLEFCRKADNWPAEGSTTNAVVLDTKTKVVGILRQSVGSMLQCLMTTLWSIPTRVAAAAALLPSLRRLLHAVDALASDLPDIVAAEVCSSSSSLSSQLVTSLPVRVASPHLTSPLLPQTDYAGAGVKWVSMPRTITRETSHPLRTPTAEVMVRIPGAKSMTLRFDQQSFNNIHNGASITLYGGPNRQRQLSQTVTQGINTHVPSDTVYIVFNSSYLSNCWGFKVAATGTVLRQVVQLPFLLDVHKGVASVAGRCAAALVRGTESPAVVRREAAEAETIRKAAAEAAKKKRAKAKAAAASSGAAAGASGGAGATAGGAGAGSGAGAGLDGGAAEGDKDPEKKEKEAAAQSDRAKRDVATWLASELVANGLTSAGASSSASDATTGGAVADATVERLFKDLKIPNPTNEDEAGFSVATLSMEEGTKLAADLKVHTIRHTQ